MFGVSGPGLGARHVAKEFKGSAALDKLSEYSQNSGIVLQGKAELRRKSTNNATCFHLNLEMMSGITGLGAVFGGYRTVDCALYTSGSFIMSGSGDTVNLMNGVPTSRVNKQ